MQGFSTRDYIVSGLIIIGVLAGWFFVMAALMGLIDPQISLPLAGLMTLVVYLIIKRKKSKPKKP